MESCKFSVPEIAPASRPGFPATARSEFSAETAKTIFQVLSIIYRKFNESLRKKWPGALMKC